MICLDFDGVIADSHQYWLDILDAALERLGEGPSQDRRPFARLHPLTFHQLAQDREMEPRLLTDAIAEEVARRSQVAPLIGGMHQVVAALADRMPLAIVSASPRRVVEVFLEKHGMRQLIAQIHGGDSGTPKAQVLLKLKQTGACVMVGDAKSDIVAGKTAGLVTCGVLWGWQDAEMLGCADHLVSTPEALLSALRPLLPARR